MNIISCLSPHTFHDFEEFSHLLSQQYLLPTEGSWSAQFLFAQKPLAIFLPYFFSLSQLLFISEMKRAVPCRVCWQPAQCPLLCLSQLHFPFDLSWALSCHFQKLSCSKTFPKQLVQSFSTLSETEALSPMCITFCLSTSICIFHFIILHHVLHQRSLGNFNPFSE